MEVIISTVIDTLSFEINMATQTLWVCLCLLALYSTNAFDYPKVRQDDSVVEDHFGTKVPDPYRWLEDPNLGETKAFIERQNNLTNGYIRSNREYNQIKDSYYLLYNYVGIEMPQKVGDKYYVLKYEVPLYQPVLYRYDNLDFDFAEEFLNPNRFAPDLTTSLANTAFSGDGNYLAYGLSVNGCDWISIAIRDTRTKQDLPETLNKVKFVFVAWNPNNQGFFYAAHDTFNGSITGTDTSVPLHQRLFYHKLNTSQSQDVLIDEMDDDPARKYLSPMVYANKSILHVLTWRDVQHKTWKYAHFDPENITGKLSFHTVTFEESFDLVGEDDDCVYVLTTEEADNGRLLCVIFKGPAPDNWIEILPARNDSVLGKVAFLSNDRLLAVYCTNGIDTIEVYQQSTRKLLYKVHTEGQVNSIAETEGGFMYQVLSFFSPGIIYQHDEKDTSSTDKTIADSSVNSLSPELFQVDQVFYPSKDGTIIPMFLIHRKDLELDGTNPTMLYAYGGFSVRTQPEYYPLGMFFAKYLKGVYAVALIRGGGDHGESWHRQGSTRNKQNGFDDFAAAAEWLIANNYTSRDYLTIHGRSNGGLLIGAITNQRPDLFGASIAGVGVHDMLRFGLHTAGAGWTSDYGDPINNHEDFQTIYKYSPYHNVPTNVSEHFPAMLLLTSTHDDRVVPSHSYKHVSMIQNRLGEQVKETPLMIRIDSNVGHWVGKPGWKLVDEFTDIICFLLNTLDYTFHQV